MGLILILLALMEGRGHGLSNREASGSWNGCQLTTSKEIRILFLQLQENEFCPQAMGKESAPLLEPPAEEGGSGLTLISPQQTTAGLQMYMT